MCLEMESNCILLPQTGQHMWRGRCTAGSGRLISDAVISLEALRKLRKLAT